MHMSKQPQLCDLPGKGKVHGMCCTTKQNHTSNDYFKQHGKSRSGSDSHLVNNVLREAKMEFKMMMHKERNHKATERKSRLIEPDHFHQMVFG